MSVKVEKFLLIFILFSLFNTGSKAQERATGSYSSVFISDLGGVTYNDVVDLYQDRSGYIWMSLFGGGLVRYDGTDFCSFRTDTPVPLCNNYTTGSVDDCHGRLWVSSVGGMDVIDLNSLKTSDLSKEILRSTKGRYCTAPVRTSDGAVWYNASNYLYRVSFKSNGDIQSRDSVKCSDNYDLRLSLAQIEDEPSVWTSIDGYITKVKFTEGRGFQVTNVNRFLYLGDENKATAMVRKENVVWIGTLNGLYALDQSTGEFTLFNEPDIIGNEITSLAVAADGRVAVGTPFGLCIYNEISEKFSFYDSTVDSFGSRSLANNLVRTILAVDDDLWVGTDRDGVSILRKKRMDVAVLRHRENDLRSLPDAPIRSIFVNSKGKQIVGTVENGFFVKEDDSFNFRGYNSRSSDLRHNSVSAIAEDARGRVWIGTLGGELDFIEVSGQADVRPVPGTEGAGLDDVNALLYDEVNDFMWISTRSGLFYYNISKSELVKCHESIRLCSGLARDREGNLWIAHSEGLTSINLKSRELKTHSLPFYALSVALDTNGTLWVGSFDQGLYTYDRRSGDTHRFSVEQGLCDNRVRGLLPDGEYLWVSTANGLCRINVNSKEIRTFSSFDGLEPYVYCDNAVFRIPTSNVLCFGHMRGATVIWSGSVVPPVMRSARLSFTEGSTGNKTISLAYPDKVEIKQKDRPFIVRFADFSYGDTSSMVFFARLYPLEKEWRKVDGNVKSLRYAGLTGGDYKLQLRAEDLSGNLLGETEKAIHVKPLFHRTFVFYLLLALFVVLVWIYADKLRTHSLKKSEERLQAEVEKQTKLLNEQKIQLEKKAEELTEQNKILLKQNEALAGHKIVASTESAAGSSNRDSKFVDKVMETIRGLYKDPDLDVQTFCEAIGMSRSVLNTKIQDAFGQSIAQFVRTYRLNVAKEILMNSSQGSVNISEVAYEIGFSDPKYFTRCFSKEFGVSPSSVLASNDDQ